MSTYTTPEPIRIVVRIPAGSISIETVDGDQTIAEIEPIGRKASLDRVREEMRPRSAGGQELRIERESLRGSGFGSEAYRVRVTTPHRAAVDLNVASAEVTCTGRFESVDVRTASAGIEVDRVEGDLTSRSASGSIRAANVGGTARASSTSGDVRIGAIGGVAHLSTVSGDVRLDQAAGSVAIETVSGDVEIGALDRGEATVRTVSGDTSLGVLPGRRVWMDVVSHSGDTSSDLSASDEAGDGVQLRIRASSVSGDVRIHRARPPVAASA